MAPSENQGILYTSIMHLTVSPSHAHFLICRNDERDSSQADYFIVIMGCPYHDVLCMSDPRRPGRSDATSSVAEVP